MQIASESRDQIDPAFISIAETARYTGECEWRIKALLKEGTLKAKKSGRRTLVIFQSVKQYAENLPDAKFAKPRPRKTSQANAAPG